jgi:hypothetical protein
MLTQSCKLELYAQHKEQNKHKEQRTKQYMNEVDAMKLYSSLCV